MKKKTTRNGKASASSKNANGKHVRRPRRWKSHLDYYDDLRALQFESEEDFARATDLLFGKELRELPFDLVGRQTIFVPAEAVPFFRGLTFSQSKVLSPDDLSAEELAEMRRR